MNWPPRFNCMTSVKKIPGPRFSCYYEYPLSYLAPLHPSHIAVVCTELQVIRVLAAAYDQTEADNVSGVTPKCVVRSIAKYVDGTQEEGSSVSRSPQDPKSLI